MSSIAQITVLGNLTRDPEAGQMPDGTPTSRFGIAVNSRRKNEDVVTYFRANVIGRQAEAVNQYLAKGRQALVVGELHQENFTKNDGTPGTSLEIRATNVQFVGGNPSAEESSTENPPAGKASAAKQPKGDSSEEDDEIPF